MGTPEHPEQPRVCSVPLPHKKGVPEQTKPTDSPWAPVLDSNGYQWRQEPGDVEACDVSSQPLSPAKPPFQRGPPAPEGCGEERRRPPNIHFLLVLHLNTSYCNYLGKFSASLLLLASKMFFGKRSAKRPRAKGAVCFRLPSSAVKASVNFSTFCVYLHLILPCKRKLLECSGKAVRSLWGTVLSESWGGRHCVGVCGFRCFVKI